MFGKQQFSSLWKRRGQPTPEASWQIIYSRILSKVFLNVYHKVKTSSFVVI